MTRKGADVRYIVTNLTKGSPQWLSTTTSTVPEGQAENLIKRHKSQLASDRTSCRSPLANQMRLILHTAAYWLMRTVREKGHPKAATVGQRRIFHHPASVVPKNRGAGPGD